jgi:cytochrome c biogenesis protein ResB
MRTLQRFLLSRRNAVAAMGLLAFLLALATAAPDGEALDALRERRPRVAWALERLRPAEVARSTVFLAITAYVAAAVLASMVSRIRTRRRAGHAKQQLERFVEQRTVHLPHDLLESERRVAAALSRAGLGRGALSGGRRDAFWGSMVFHAGLIVTLVGIALSAFGRFGGEVVLVEGFPVEVSPRTFLRASPPAGLAPLQGARLSVSDVSATYHAGTRLVDVSAVVAAELPGRPPERRFVSVNVPVDLGEFQLTLHAYGFAPEIAAVDPSGRTRVAGVAALRVLPPGTEDALVLDGGGVLRLRFYPDRSAAGSASGGASAVPLRPVLAFRWYERGALVAEGIVESGGETVVAGYRVAFPRLSYWADLIVGRDPGLPWFVLGCTLGVFGLAVRFGRHEQSWSAELQRAADGTELRLTLSARYFPALLRDRADRVARLAAE